MDEACARRPLTRNGKQFEQEWGLELGMKKIRKKKRNPPASSLSVDEDINV